MQLYTKIKLLLPWYKNRKLKFKSQNNQAIKQPSYLAVWNGLYSRMCVLIGIQELESLRKFKFYKKTRCMSIFSATTRTTWSTFTVLGLVGPGQVSNGGWNNSLTTAPPTTTASNRLYKKNQITKISKIILNCSNKGKKY